MEIGTSPQPFPLQPFLLALSAEGFQLTVRDYERIALVLRANGPWTILRLRDALRALLARDEDQCERFDSCFETFFDLDLASDPALAALDVRQALAFLEEAALRDVSPVEKERGRLPQPPPPPPPARGNGRHWWRPLAVLLLLPVVALVATAIALTPNPGAPPPLSPATVTPAPMSPTVTGDAAYRIYRNVPVVAEITTFRRSRSGAWVLPLGLGLALLATSAFYGMVLYPRRHPPDEEPASFDTNPELPRHFSLGAVGGTPAPLLGDADLDELADALSYFASSEAGPTLNVAASVEGTLRRGGIPTLTFFHQQRLRSVLILEDRRSEARRWNTLPAELAAGLSRRGVPVIHGSFAGAPDRYTTPDGAFHMLEDLEDQRHAFVLLIFSDGEQLRRHFDPFALEALAFWPQVAWFDLREPRFWNTSISLLDRYGLPCYPATPAGVLQALRRFLSEQRADPAATPDGAAVLELAEPASPGMASSVEQLLGDALPWAQACALIQPVSPGLADKLRRRFHPQLPPQRIERLYRLPDTRVDQAGLWFCPEVLAFLRRSCLERRSAAERTAVLDYILAQIAAAEPAERTSLAHLSWEAALERVRLERDPDDDLARLAQIAHSASPLRNTIRASLNGFGFPDQDDRVPLMVKPRKPQALLRLSRIAGGFAPPPSRAHQAAIGSLLAAGVALLGLSALLWLRAAPEGPDLVITFPDRSLHYVGVGKSGAELAGVGLVYADAPQTGALSAMQPLATRSGGAPALAPVDAARLPVAPSADAAHNVAGSLPRDADQLLIVGGGHWLTQRDLAPPAPEAGLHIRVTQPPGGELAKPCRETLDASLSVQRCPEPATGAVFEQSPWRELVGGAVAHDRVLSVGLEIAGDDGEALRAWRNLLLRSSSVDLIYRVTPSADDDDWLAPALAQIEEDLGLLAVHAQIAWWSGDGAVDPRAVEDELRGFDRRLHLAPGVVGGDWLGPLSRLFADEQPGPLPEATILAALGRTPGGPGGRELVWMVPAQAGPVPAPTDVPPWAPALVAVPAGPFLMGSSAADTLASDNEKPQHTVTLPAYWIGKTEVTNAQFRPFVEGDGYTNRAYWTADGWAWKEELKRTQPLYWNIAQMNGDDQPVTGVSWYEAVAYVRWLSAQTGHEFRLPTEAEWEKAARSADGRIWPWGNEWAEGRANTAEARVDLTTPVGGYPEGASPYGALDMAGNIWEWCATVWPKPYPYTIEDEWTTEYLERREARALRGGSWTSQQVYARGANRNNIDARDDDNDNVGLRVASHSPYP